MKSGIMDKGRRVLAWTQASVLTVLFTNLAWIPYAQAAPTGGTVVGGSGSISQSGANTTINQTSQNMAIDWSSYNVNTDERVQYIQPNRSSISLNRILSNTASEIRGRIDANGQVILVNPHGMVFTDTAVINVGGIVASALDIQPSAFMNGDFIFNDIPGTEGKVVNSGIINASVGGNVTLLGKQVQNDGLIMAKLGSVNLAAGKEAVLTFDNEGLVGVKITKEILQEEIGIDPAVINNGKINAEGGRVLLTASVSQDVFSQAVNSNGLNQATSVVVHPDGTFTLGGGADVINSGTIDVSKTTDTANDPNVARIVLIGENVTSSGKIRADNINGNGGEIELHANNTTLLTGESLVSARSDTNGQGGIVKVLGNHVGLFDQSVVDVSGDLGGGQALIGGDYQGNNPLMRNANRTIIAPGANVYANALTNGDGGKVILWADDYTLFYGNLFARGGSGSGNGGFAEVSGKNYLEFHGDVDLTALMGSNGVLLLDPKNITISSGPTSGGTFPAPNQFDQFSDLASTSTNLNSVALSNQLNSSSVRLQANTDISIEANITGSNSLELYAGRSISIANNVQINLGLRNNEQFYAEINATGANAANRDAGLATFTMGAGSSINIISDVNDDPSGNIVITTGNFTGNNIGDITLQTLNTSSPGGDNSGDITVTNSVGDIVSNSQILAEGNSTSVNGERGGNITLTATLGNISINSGATISAIGGSGEGAQDGEVGDNGGNITLTAGNDITINATLASDGGHGGDFGTGGSGDFAGAITINAGNDLNINSAITADGGDGRGTGNRNAGNAGTINLTAGNNLTVTATVSAKGGNAVNNGDAGDAGNVTLTAGNDITISQNISSYRGLLPGTGVIGADATITLNGDAGDNIFNINDGAQLYATTVTLNGLGGNDTLVAGGATGSTNIWTINGLNGGILDNSNGVNFTTPDNENLTGDINFSNIESLTGGLQQDTFDLTAGNIQGLIDGGAGATDSLTITPNSRTVRLGNVAIADAVLDPFLNVNNVETITAGGGTNTIISAADQGYTWTVDSNTTGIVKPTTVFTAENTVTFGNFTVLTGGDNIDTFNISADKTWTINGGVGADIFNISSNYTGNISGGADNDTFNITALGLNSMTLFGDTGDDTLVAANEGNDWSIVDFDGGGGSVADGINDGTLNGGIEFVDIENLTGNEAVDTFTIQAGADIDGLIDGGTHTTDVNVVDTLTITDAGKTVELGIRTTYDPARISVHNVETITASGTGNTIIGAEQNNFWTVDGVSARVAGTETSPPADTVVTFANFDAIQGGSLSDQFDLSVDFGGTITGAAGTDTFNLTASQTGSMSGGDDSDTFNINAENITLTINGGTAGTTDVDTVVGADSTSINTWSFNSYTTADGSNGTLTNSGGTVTFNNIETATGGTGADQFTVTATGGIDTLSGGSASGDELVVNSLAADTINWTISSDNAGSVATNKVGSFTQIQTLTGGDGVDNFDISGAMTTISGSGNADDFNINVATTATINGNGGNDTFDIFANVNAGGSLNGGDENDTFTLRADGLNVASINGGTTGTTDVDTVVGADSSFINTWSFTGYTVADGSNGTLTNNGATVNFNNIETATGGTGADQFTVTTTGGIDTIDGGSSSGDELVVNSLAADTINWTISSDNAGSVATNKVGGFTQIQTLTGGAGMDNFDISGAMTTISGGGNTDDFNINVATTATINGNGGNDTFDIFANVNAGGSLNGGDENDTFTLRADGLNVASINGGTAGTTDVDTVVGADSSFINTWSFTGYTTADGSNGTLTNSGGTVNFNNIETATGGTGADQFTVTTTGGIDTVDGGSSSGDELVVNSLAADTINWTISSDNAGSVATNKVGSFTQIQTLTGGDGVDNFAINGAMTTINGGGNDDDFNINVATTATINGNGGDDTFDIFANVNAGGVLNGGDGDDTFTLQNLGLTVASIIGGDANEINGDTLVSAIEDNYWNMTGTNTGTISGITTQYIPSPATAAVSDGSDRVTFSGVENLTGNQNSDYFKMNLGSDITGNIVGGDGAGDPDVFDVSTWGPNPIPVGNMAGIEELFGGGGGDFYAGGSGLITWIINGDGSGTVNGINFSGFTNLFGSDDPAGDDLFILQAGGFVTGTIDGRGGNNTVEAGITGGDSWDVSNTWNITGAGTGSVVKDGDPASLTDFVNIQNLTGGEGNDRFNFQLNGVIAGTVDGGGTGTNIIDMSAVNAVTALHVRMGVDADPLTMDVLNVGQIRGNGNASSTLYGDATTASTFNVKQILDINATLTDGADDGEIAGVVTFENFANLTGGAQSDSFTIETSGTLSGAIDGVGAGNTLTVQNAGTNSWVINDANIGTVTKLGSGFSNVENLVGGAGSDDFLVTGSGSIGSINGVGNGNSLNMNIAGALIWTINSADGGNNDLVAGFSGIQTLTGSTGNDTFGISADYTGTINGNSGGDTFNITSSVSGILNGDAGTDTYNINDIGLVVNNINGGTEVDTLNLANEANYVVIDAANGGRVYNTGVVVNQIPANQRSGFAGVENINGNANIDNFRITGVGSINNITGGNGSNSLNMDIAAVLNWSISSANGGSNDRVSSFTGIQTLTGSTGNDTFGISADYTGTINGNSGGDTFNITSSVSGILNGDAGTDTYNINDIGLVVNNINGGTEVDTLNLANEANYVVIDAANGGRVYNTGVVVNQIPANQRSGFAGVENINGNANIDNFRITGVGSINNITGGIGGNDLNMDLAAALNWTINSANGGGNDRVSSFTGIQTLTGSTGNDTFGISADFTGTINAGSGGDTFNITSNVSGNLNGQGGGDTYNINGTGLIVSNINGGGSVDTLNLANEANYVVIDAANGGRVYNTGVVVNQIPANQRSGFTSVENINGSDNIDDFRVTGTGSISNITGGIGSNSLNMDIAGNLNWTINSADGGSNGRVNSFSGMQALTGSTGNDTFGISADYTGTINGNNGVDTFNITSSVSGILNGDAGTDTYNINSLGLVVNGIDGGADTDTLNLANEANYVVIDAVNGGRVYNTGVVANQIPANQRSGFADVENINGNTNIDDFRITGVGSINNITGGNGSNNLNMNIATALNWTINSANGGSNDRVSSFTGMQTLTGSTGVDTFAISADFTGIINANNGNDIFNITASVSGNLNGQSGDDVYNLQTGNLIVPNIDGGEGGETNGDQIVGFNETNYWNITGVDSGTLARTSATPVMVTYANIENLTGSSNTDYFNITATGNLTAIGTGGVVNGAGGNNDTLAGRLSSDNNWSISAVNTGQVVVNGETIPYAKFSSVENLQGGDAIDVFALTTTTATIGSIDGGTVVGGDPATYNEIIGRNTAEIWTIDSGDGGNVSGVIGSFSNIQNLTGALTQNDTFTFLVGGSLTGLIDGRGNTTGDIMNMTLAGLGAINVVLGEDVVNVETINGNNDAGSTLVGTLGTNNWNITGANDGNVDIGSVVNFTNFANLSGNDDVPNSIFSTDIFTFVGANGSISGRLDGKRGQNDQLFVQTVGDVIVTLLDGAAPLPGDVIFNGIISTSTAEVVNVDGIETITANGADTNLLVAANTNNTWLIDGANSGLVMPAVGADAENTIRFNNFDNIRGGTENDNFRITSGNISGIIDGNENFTNTDIDSLDYSLQPGPYTVDLSSGSVLGSVKRAEGVIGNSTNMTLRADDINNIWDIAGDNSGVLNDAIPASRYTFSGFTYLVGGDANDTFNVTGSGGLLGGTQPRQQIILRGGLGDDELNVMLASGTGDFGVIFDGQAGQNSVNIDGGTGAVYSAAYTPNTFTLDAIVYDEISYTNDQNANNYRVRFANVVDVLAEIAVQDMTVNGNAGVDSFVLGSGIATDTGTVTRTLKAPLDRNYFSVNGDTGVYYANATNLTVNGDNADTIDVSNVSSVTGTLTLTGDTVTTSGSISTSGLVLSGVNTAGTLGTRLNTSVSTLSVINSGSVYLDEANGITDIVLSGTTVFDLLAANDVISTSAITTSAGQVLTIDAANISLTGPNSIAGVINLNGANVTLNNTGDTNLGNVTASGTLAVNVSGGGLTDSGQVEGLTVADFNVSGGSVVLDTAGNDFGSTILTVDGGSATLVDSNDITLDSVNITGGDLSVTATGINVGIVSADNVRLNARSGAIVDNNNDDQVNISTGLLYMRAGAGIGEPMDPLEVSATELDVMNTGAGGSEINISNDRAVTVTNLVNIGDITFSNIGNVTVNRIDADYDTGTLTMNVENGDVIGTPLRPGYFNYSLVPDISAYSALILAQDGNFGTSSRPISMWIKNDLTLVSITNAIHYFNNIPPPNRDLSGQSLAVTTGADLAQALIEVESLAEIDPAIFTEVRNYYHDDVAISMPLDQRYVVDDNEDEEKKRKKEAEEAENIKLN